MSEIRATTISDAAGTGPITLTAQSAAKVFVNANHSTNTIQESLNVSSLTDNATGQMTFTFTNNMSSTTYSVSDSHLHHGGITYQTSCSIRDGLTASAFAFTTSQTQSTTFFDTTHISGQAYGDLA